MHVQVRRETAGAGGKKFGAHNLRVDRLWVRNVLWPEYNPEGKLARRRGQLLGVANSLQAVLDAPVLEKYAALRTAATVL